MPADLSESLSSIKSVAQQIMSAFRIVSSTTKTLNVCVPQHCHRLHLIDSGFGDLRAHHVPPFPGTSHARIESNLQAIARELVSGCVVWLWRVAGD
jgi:hypothetical protein